MKDSIVQRILHVTDTHIRPETSVIRSVDNMAALEEMIEWVGDSALFADGGEEKFLCDLAVHTGDLITRPADSHAYGVYARIISQLKMPIFHIPGNHDDAQMMAHIVPGSAEEYPWVVNRPGIRLIGLDSSQGALDCRQIDRLSRILETDGNSILFIHHQVGSIGDSWLNDFQLENSDELEHVLSQARSGIAGIVHGHVHHHTEYRLSGVPVYSGMAMAAQFDPYGGFQSTTEEPPGCSILTVYSSGRIERTVHSFPNRILSEER